jgi:heme exporter protein B
LCVRRRDTRPRPLRAARDCAAGARVTYLRDTAALARKDVLLELRAKETLPAMLLFVVSALTIFHFALPRGTDDVAARGLLWSALVFTALLGLTRAFVAEREQGMFDALVLAPCDRSAIWLAKAIAVLAFLAAAEAVAVPAFAAFFHGLDGRTVAAVALADVGIASVGTLFGAMAVAGRARELLLPLLFLPAAIPIVVGGVGGYLWFLALYDVIFSVLAWAAFEYVVAEA